MTINLPDTAHPVKDIVLPLAVVVALVGNALFVGIAWGKFTYRIDHLETKQQETRLKNESQDQLIQNHNDRIRDLERDEKEDQRRFLQLDDYTRGRIDHLPYKPPPPARW